MKKNLDPTTIINELKGSSLYFPATENSPTLGEASQEAPRDPVRTPASPESAPTGEDISGGEKNREEIQSPPNDTTGRKAVPPYGRTGIRGRRNIKRYAFEFFQDQLDTLKQFSIEEQIRGESGSMSRMVREAIDAYLAKRKRTEE